MIRFFLRSSIQGVTVTAVDSTDDGAVKIDRHLMNAAGLLPFEKVDVLNGTRGTRFEAWVVEAPPGKGEVTLSGSGMGQAGDMVTIAAFCLLHDGQTLEHRATRLRVDRDNRVIALEQLESDR